MSFDYKYLGHNFIQKYNSINLYFKCTNCNVTILYEGIMKNCVFIMSDNYLGMEPITCEEMIIKNIIDHKFVGPYNSKYADSYYYFKCKKCSIEVHYNKNINNDIECISSSCCFKFQDILKDCKCKEFKNLTCEEIVIKNIIE